VALNPRHRAAVYMSSSALAVLGLHAAFISLIVGWSFIVPMAASLMFVFIAGGYAWPPIANRPAWSEAARLVGWSEGLTRGTLVLINVVTLLLVVDGVVYLSTS
jgi:hypothetical protein